MYRKVAFVNFRMSKRRKFSDCRCVDLDAIYLDENVS